MPVGVAVAKSGDAVSVPAFSMINVMVGNPPSILRDQVPVSLSGASKSMGMEV